MRLPELVSDERRLADMTREKIHGLQDFNQLFDLIYEDDRTMFMRVNARCAHHLRPPDGPSWTSLLGAEGRIARPWATYEE